MSYLSGEQFRNTEFEGEEWIDETRPSTDPIQKLMFHPHTGMQTFEDPLEDTDKRHEAIKKSLLPFGSQTTHDIFEKGQGLRHGLTVSNIPTYVFHKTKDVTISPSEAGDKGAFVTRRGWDKDTAEIKVPPKLDLSDSPHTYTHEFGHARDFNIHGRSADRPGDTDVTSRRRTIRGQKYPVTTSPISEGIADGYSDRYSGGGFSGQQPVSYIDPAINPENAAELVKGSGYTVHYSGWRNRQAQALYAATRMHVAHHGDDGIKSLPNFNKHHDDYTELHEKKNQEAYIALKYSEMTPFDPKKAQVHARHGYLGELLHKNPALHAGLTHLGFGDIADSAIQYRHKQQVIKAAQESTQPALPGFKTNEEIALSQLKNTNPLASPITAKQLRRTDPHSRGAKAKRTREINKKYWG